MTYKAYENKAPNMIKERIDQDYDSILRAALTSIKGVNKTDVLTMKTNFGVRILGPENGPVFLIVGSSKDFATMSRATFEELQLCPGFGKVKARRVKDAFERPFFPGRNATLDAVGKGKGKEKAQDVDNEMSKQMDVQGVSNQSEETGEPRQYSPDWNIDLDLNPSDDEEEPLQPPAESPSPQPPSSKKRRPNPFSSSG